MFVEFFKNLLNLLFKQTNNLLSSTMESLCNLPDGAGRGSNLGPKISSFLSNRTSNTGTLHFTLRVNDDTSVIFEIEENAVLSSPALSLSDNNSGHDYA